MTNSQLNNAKALTGVCEKKADEADHRALPTPAPFNFNVDWLVLHECRGGAKKKPIFVSQVLAEITTLKLGGGGARPNVKVRTARSAFFSQTPVRAFALSSC